MTSEQIREKIRYYERLIAQYTEQKTKKEEDLYELERLKIKVTDLQTRFEQRQDCRKKNLAVLAAMPQRNRIYPAYCNGMQELLSGQEFIGSYNGVSEAGERVRKEAQNVSDQIESYENRINAASSKKEYWKSQLRTALAEEAEEREQ